MPFPLAHGSIKSDNLRLRACVLESLRLCYKYDSTIVEGKKLSHYRNGQAFRGSKTLRLPEFLGNGYMKVVRLSALCTGRVYPQETFLVLISVRG
jgi:hypothetical protein